MALLFLIASLVSLAPPATALRMTKEQGNSSLAENSYTIVGTGVYCYDPGSVTTIYQDYASSPEQCRAWCDENADCGAYATYTGGRDPHCGSTGGACYGWSGCSGTHSSGCVPSGSTVISYLKDPTPSAVGDPHLQNVHGERFDMMKEGNHVLLNIPRGMSAESAMLRVLADARRVGGHCADIYFQQLNITGFWAEAKHVGGYHYSTSQDVPKAPQWAAFGKVELKVVKGHTESGVTYLNLYARHLGLVGFDVGGLLGLDDHSDVMTSPTACAKRLALKVMATGGSGQAPRSVPPVAMATFA